MSTGCLETQISRQLLSWTPGASARFQAVTGIFRTPRADPPRGRQPVPRPIPRAVHGLNREIRYRRGPQCHDVLIKFRVCGVPVEPCRPTTNTATGKTTLGCCRAKNARTSSCSPDATRRARLPRFRRLIFREISLDARPVAAVEGFEPGPQRGQEQATQTRRIEANLSIILDFTTIQVQRSSRSALLMGGRVISAASE